MSQYYFIHGHLASQGKSLPKPKSLSEWRKQRPAYEGFIKYFPDAIMEASHLSMEGNAKHNGTTEHPTWDKSKSADEKDCLARHLCDLAATGDYDDDGIWQEVKAFWRAGANLQRKIDTLRDQGLYPPKF